MKARRKLLLALAWLLLALFPNRGRTQNAPPPQLASAPDVRVEFFGPEQGYAVGSQNVTLLCVARNVGTAPLPENTLRLRCFTVVGLDYTAGDTRPTLPALASNQSVAFRWRLAPSRNQGAMVAAVLIENVANTGSGPAADGGQNPQSVVQIPPDARATLAVIPRLSNTPRPDNLTFSPGAAPRASNGLEEATIANDRVQARVIAGERRFPLLVLAAREGKAWRALATGAPLIEVNGGEDGQLPWWETFRWKETRVRNEKTGATLTLTGEIGKRWRAELTLEAKPGTAALEGRLRVTPLRTLRLYGVRLPRLLPIGGEANGSKSDGSTLSVFQNDPILPDDARVRAARSEGITFGITWPAAPPLADWEWSSPATYDTNLLSVLGAEWIGPDAGGIIQPGASVEFSFRLFAFGPSDTLKDALRFMPP